MGATAYDDGRFTAELAGELQTIPEAGTVLVVAPAGELKEWRELIERFDREEPIFTEHYGPRRFGLRETAALIEQVVHVADSTERAGSWRMVEDHLTGTLIVTTTPSRHREIQNLIARLESTSQGARRPLRTFPIRHRQVSDVVEVLRQLLEAGVIETPPQLAAGPEAAPQGRIRTSSGLPSVPQGACGGERVSRRGSSDGLAARGGRWSTGSRPYGRPIRGACGAPGRAGPHHEPTGSGRGARRARSEWDGQLGQQPGRWAVAARRAPGG